MNNLAKTVLFLCLTIGFCSCTLTQTREDAALTTDMFEIERLANAAYEAGNYEESEKYYTVLVKQVPQESQNWFRLGNAYARTKKMDSAVLAYREALVRDPEFNKAWYNLGLVQLRQSLNSFVEMQLYADKTDPLYTKSKELIDGILGLLNEDTTE